MGEHTGASGGSQPPRSKKAEQAGLRQDPNQQRNNLERAAWGGLLGKHSAARISVHLAPAPTPERTNLIALGVRLPSDCTAIHEPTPGSPTYLPSCPDV